MRTSHVGLLPRTLSPSWLPKTNSCYFSNWAYVTFTLIHRKPVILALMVAEQLTIDISPTVASVSQWRDCLLRCLGDACDVTAACSSPLAERGDTERTPLPLPQREVLSGQLTRNALLRNPTMGWHVTIYSDMSTHCWITQQSVAR
jgi:hypothetical protein